MRSIPKPIKFLVAGGSAAVTEYLLFIILVGSASGASIIAIQVISFLAGFVVSFTLNKVWVFSSKSSGKTRSELLKYGLLALVNLAIGSLIIWLLVDVNGFNAYIAKIIVMVLIAVWNYFIFQKIIFK